MQFTGVGVGEKDDDRTQTRNAEMTERKPPEDYDDPGLPDPADAPPPLPAKDVEREAVAAEPAIPPAVAKPIVVEKAWHKRWTTRVLAGLIIVPLLIFAVW